MGENYNLKLNVTLDSDRDAAIIEFFEELKAKHKTPEFMRQLLEATLEGGILDLDGAQGLKNLSDNLEKWVDTSPKNRFINEVSAKCNKIIETVNRLYSMASEVYMSAKLGQAIGAEDRSKNILCAQFMIEYEINKLNAMIGAVINDSSYASRRMEELDKMVNDVLHTTIERYSGILNEIKNASVQIVQQPANSVQISNISNEVQTATKDTNDADTESSNQEIILDLTPDEEAVMDMDIEDNNLDALLDFFN